MLGPEGVATSIKTQLDALLPARLTALRTELDLTAAELPAVRSVHDYVELNANWTSTSLPLVQIDVKSDGTARRMAPTTLGQSWQFEYQVSLIATVWGKPWRACDLIRKRYLRALREIVLDTAGIDADDIVYLTRGRGLTETLLPMRNDGHGATSAWAHSAVQFTARTTEAITHPAIGTADTIELYLDPVPVAAAIPDIPTVPAPDVEDFPAPFIIPAP